MSRSVFADLGYADPQAAEIKSCLVIAINRAVDERGLTQTRAAEIIRMDQPTLSKLLRGRTRSVSIEKLTEMLNALGRDVKIVIETRIDSDELAPRGRTSVVFAGEE